MLARALAVALVAATAAGSLNLRGQQRRQAADPHAPCSPDPQNRVGPAMHDNAGQPWTGKTGMVSTEPIPTKVGSGRVDGFTQGAGYQANAAWMKEHLIRNPNLPTTPTPVVVNEGPSRAYDLVGKDPNGPCPVKVPSTFEWKSSSSKGGSTAVITTAPVVYPSKPYKASEVRAVLVLLAVLSCLTILSTGQREA